MKYIHPDKIALALGFIGRLDAAISYNNLIPEGEEAQCKVWFYLNNDGTGTIKLSCRGKHMRMNIPADEFTIT